MRREHYCAPAVGTAALPRRTAKQLPSAAEQCEWLIESMTEIELAVIDELIRFERLVAAARRGSIITLGGFTLTADSFASIFRDLTTYCIENWDTRDYRRVCLVERQVMRLGGYLAVSASIACNTEDEMSIKDSYTRPIRRFAAWRSG